MDANRNLHHVYEEMLRQRAQRQAGSSEEMAGTCRDFCPDLEKIERVLKNDISAFEARVVVKKYQRSSAGKLKSLPEDIRPLPVLVMVMEHLFSLIPQHNDLLEVYKFVEDRSRAVRLDIAVQGLEDDVATYELEKIARFHVVFTYLLFSDPRFEIHLNTEQLKKIVVTLLDLHKKRRDAPGRLARGEEEFMSYFILLHMDDKSTFSYVQDFFLKGYSQVDLCVRVYESYQANDFYHFFRLWRIMDFLSACILLVSMRSFWAKAVDACKASLVESIGVGFFEMMFSCVPAKILKIMQIHGVPASSGKLDFKNKSDFVGEDDYELLKSDLDGKMQQDIVKTIKHGQLDLFTRRLVLREYVGKTIATDAKPREATMNTKSVLEVVLRTIVREYTLRMLVSIRQKLGRADGWKRAEVVKWVSKHIIRQKVSEMCKNMAHVGGSVEKTAEGGCLVVVHTKDVYSVLFKQKLMKTTLSSQKPQFVLLDNATVDFLLRFNFCIFCVDSRDVAGVNQRFFMINKVVGTAQDLEDKIKDTQSVLELCRKPRTVKDRLFNVIDGKTQHEATEIVIELLRNSRNGRDLEQNLFNIYNGKPLVDSDVYFEEGAFGA